MSSHERRKGIEKTLMLILILNLFVALLKMLFGLLARSLSMVADALHSLFDSTSNIIGLIGIRISAKPPDAGHPYGHQKFESFATIGIAVLIFISFVEILESAIGRFRNPVVPNITPIVFGVMVVTLLVNIFVALYEKRRGIHLHSTILVADSQHTQSDVFASVAVLFGFAAVKLGYPILDPIIALVIAGLIARVGYGIIKQTSDCLCDASMLNPTDVRNIVMKVPGVLNCHRVRTRGIEDNVYVDLHLVLDKKTSLKEGHDISHDVEAALKKQIQSIKDVTIHMEPGK